VVEGYCRGIEVGSVAIYQQLNNGVVLISGLLIVSKQEKSS